MNKYAVILKDCDTQIDAARKHNSPVNAWMADARRLAESHGVDVMDGLIAVVKVRRDPWTKEWKRTK